MCTSGNTRAIAFGLSVTRDSCEIRNLKTETVVKKGLDKARGYSSRGFGPRGGGGTHRGSGAGRSARQSSGNGRAATPKGQINSGKTVQYSIKDPKGITKYIGTTNNPSRRSAEHRQSGKLGQGDKLVVETRAVSRTSAERVETAKLASYRQNHGDTPKHNTTKDGKYHP